MSNIFGRQVIVLLLNNSGGGVIAGDVVVPDGTANSAFTTTTSASSTVPVWVVQETIASAATGRVLISGYAALVNVNASVTRGHYGATFTVAKQATDGGASRTAGTFCRFLTGGTTPIAYVYSTDLLGSSLSNPMTNEGDLIRGGAAGTPTRVAVGGAGQLLASNGTDPIWSNYGTTYTVPMSFSGDTIDGSSTTPFVDTSAFSLKEVLNSRVLHLQTLGASKDQRVRVTLGTTKAAAFDVTTVVSFNGAIWSANRDVYFEIRLSTSADAQLCIARIGLESQANATAFDTRQSTAVIVGGSTIQTANSNSEFTQWVNQSYTIRFVRDGSNVITFGIGGGTAPLALATPVVLSNDVPFSATVSGTLARVEYSIHTPSGPGSTAQWDAYVAWLASV